MIVVKQSVNDINERIDSQKTVLIFHPIISLVHAIDKVNFIAFELYLFVQRMFPEYVDGIDNSKYVNALDFMDFLPIAYWLNVLLV